MHSSARSAPKCTLMSFRQLVPYYQLFKRDVTRYLQRLLVTINVRPIPFYTADRVYHKRVEFSPLKSSTCWQQRKKGTRFKNINQMPKIFFFFFSESLWSNNLNITDLELLLNIMSEPYNFSSFFFFLFWLPFFVKVT